MPGNMNFCDHKTTLYFLYPNVYFYHELTGNHLYFVLCNLRTISALRNPANEILLIAIFSSTAMFTDRTLNSPNNKTHKFPRRNTRVV